MITVTSDEVFAAAKFQSGLYRQHEVALSIEEYINLLSLEQKMRSAIYDISQHTQPTKLNLQIP